MDGFFALLGESEIFAGEMIRLPSVILDMLLDKQTKGRLLAPPQERTDSTDRFE